MTRRHVIAALVCAAIEITPELALAQKEVVQQAIAEFTTAIAGTFGDEGTLIGPTLDRMSAGLAEWDQAIQTFEARVVSESPSAPPRAAAQLHTDLGKMYAERGRLDAAVREFDAASRLNPSDPVSAYYAFHLAEKNGNDTAVQRARLTMAAAYQRVLGEGGAAKAKSSAFPIVSGADGDLPLAFPPALYARGYARLARGEHADAIAEFRRAASTDPLVVDPAARSSTMRQAASLLRRGHLAEARTILESTGTWRESAEARRILGLTYWAAGQHDKSIELFTSAIRDNEEDERSRVALARVLNARGQQADAQQALHDTIARFPDSALAHWWLGSAYADMNRLVDARHEFERASSAAITGRSQLHVTIGRLAADAGDFAAAAAAFEDAVAANPNDAAAHKLLAGVLLQQDEADASFVELVAAVLIDPLDAGAHIGIGQIHLNAGRDHEAVASLRRALELSPNDLEARYALATALMRVGDRQDAARELDRVELVQRQALSDRRRTMSYDVLKEEATLRAAEGHVETAIVLLEKAAALGVDPSVYRQLADLYEKAGRLDHAARARAMYERTRQQTPRGGATAR